MEEAVALTGTEHARGEFVRLAEDFYGIKYEGQTCHDPLHFCRDNGIKNPEQVIKDACEWMDKLEKENAEGRLVDFKRALRRVMKVSPNFNEEAVGLNLIVRSSLRGNPAEIAAGGAQQPVPWFSHEASEMALGRQILDFISAVDA